MNDARRYDFYQGNVPWWDAAALKGLMAVEGEDIVRQKLMLLFGVPSVSYDISRGETVYGLPARGEVPGAEL